MARKAEIGEMTDVSDLLARLQEERDRAVRGLALQFPASRASCCRGIACGWSRRARASGMRRNRRDSWSRCGRWPRPSRTPTTIPNYPREKFRYRIIPDEAHSITLAEPVLVDHVLRPERANKGLSIGRFLQGPRKITEPDHAAAAGRGRSATGTSLVERKTMSTLTPWRQVVEPHADIRLGKFDSSVFAADLGEVMAGRGAVDYRDACTFFAKTYLTEGLSQLLIDVMQRLGGRRQDGAGDPAPDFLRRRQDPYADDAVPPVPETQRGRPTAANPKAGQCRGTASRFPRPGSPAWWARPSMPPTTGPCGANWPSNLTETRRASSMA